MELVKLLTSPHPEILRTAYETGITAVMLPEFDRCMETPQENPHHTGSVGEHTLLALMKVQPDKVLRLTMLLHDFGKPATRKRDETNVDHFYGHGVVSEELAVTILHRLKFDNDTLRKVRRLVRHHDEYLTNPTARNVRRAVCRIGEDLFPLYLEVRRGDILAQNPVYWEEKLQNLEQTEDIYRKILEENNCLSLKNLAVTGHDLIEACVAPDKQVGEKLQELLELVIDEPECNVKEVLLNRIKGV